MSRNPFATLFSGLAALALLSSCLEPDYDHFGLWVQARGLATDEIITVSNGSTLQVAGNETLGWTEPQKFKRRYRSDRTNYHVRIIRQSSNSNKSCRVLNPTGTAGHANSMVRIECGYPVVIADTQMSMTSDNGLIVSNQFQKLALNASRMLVTSLLHEVVQDPTSANQDDKKLRVTAKKQDGAISFNELYLEGEPVTLSFSSVNQGCQITDPVPAPTDNSSLAFNFPSPDALNTVQTIPLNADWIVNEDNLGNGRTCQDFKSDDEYFLGYSAAENPEGGNNYSAACFPASPITMTCGLALQLQVRGLDGGDSLVVTANRDGSFDHAITFEKNATRTFNLAFKIGDEFTMAIDTAQPLPSGKTCTFNNVASGVFNAAINIKREISCAP